MSENPTPTEIGKFYSVPCVLVKEGTPLFPIVPVNGPYHDDKEIIGFPFEHFHIDWRFVSPSVFNRTKNRVGVVGVTTRVLVSNEIASPTVVMRRRKCYRRMPDFALPRMSWFEELQKKYGEHRLPNGCAKCPHRGIDLRTGDVRDGVVICPGHGLQWNLRTGRLVPRARASL